MEEGEGIGGRGTKRHGGYISLVSATQQILVFLSVTQRCSVFPVSGSLHLRLSQALLSASPAHPTTAGLLGTRLSLCTYPDSLPLHPQYHPNIFPALSPLITNVTLNVKLLKLIVVTFYIWYLYIVTLFKYLCNSQPL